MRCPIDLCVIRRHLHASLTLAALAAALFLCVPSTRAENPPANNGGLFDFGKDPLKPGVKPKLPPTTQPAQIGAAEIQVVATRLDYVTLLPSTEHGPAPEGVDPINSQDKFLQVKLLIRNTGDRPLTYHTFAFPFGPAGRETYASLGLGRKMLTLVNFGDQEPQGLTRTAEIPPGKSVTDILVFLPIPDLDAKSIDTPLKLTLPPQQLGAEGKLVRIDLDFANVQQRR